MKKRRERVTFIVLKEVQMAGLPTDWMLFSLLKVFLNVVSNFVLSFSQEEVEKWLCCQLTIFLLFSFLNVFFPTLLFSLSQEEVEMVAMPTDRDRPLHCNWFSRSIFAFQLSEGFFWMCFTTYFWIFFQNVFFPIFFVFVEMVALPTTSCRLAEIGRYCFADWFSGSRPFSAFPPLWRSNLV